MKNNQEAFDFFDGLYRYLNERVPAWKDMRVAIKKIVTESKINDDAHKRFPEGALLNTYITPYIHKYLVESMKLSHGQATRSLLSESFRKLPDIASASPARFEAHPFQKAVGATPQKIMSVWRDENKALRTTRSCPDVALRNPCQYKAVFEGKYFSSGGQHAADAALVTGLYQSFFYLGLSKQQETKTRPAWDFDYSCLLAYDASEDSSLKNAWETLHRDVKKACWNGANIYVMILTGT